MGNAVNILHEISEVKKNVIKVRKKLTTTDLIIVNRYLCLV
jgi:hypothetical protein